MNLQVFNNFQFGKVTVITINDEPWFIAKQVATILGYGNGNNNSKAISNAIAKYVDKYDERMIPYNEAKELFGGHQNSDHQICTRGVKLINESGLYSLIFGSTLRESIRFKRWVTHDILPAIRKIGEYRVDYNTRNSVQGDEVNITIAKALLVSKELLEESRQAAYVLRVNNEIKEKEIEEAKPKLDYYNTILQSVNAIKTTQIAADYGLSARALNQILHEERIQYKVNKQWILYAKHKNKGYTGSKSKIIHRSNGTDEAIITTYWTQRGRLFIHKILRDRGIVAVMDRVGEVLSVAR